MGRKHCFKVGDHRVKEMSREVKIASGGKNGSGAFGCRIEVRCVTEYWYRCVSQACHASSGNINDLMKMPHLVRKTISYNLLQEEKKDAR